MLLRHATLARRLASIRRADLQAGRAVGRIRAVWLHSPGKTGWALSHVVLRHGGRVESVVVLELTVPRSWLRRWGKGLWYCQRDIPAARIRRVIRFGEAAASPVEG